MFPSMLTMKYLPNEHLQEVGHASGLQAHALVDLAFAGPHRFGLDSLGRFGLATAVDAVQALLEKVGAIHR